MRLCLILLAITITAVFGHYSVFVSSHNAMTDDEQRVTVGGSKDKLCRPGAEGSECDKADTSCDEFADVCHTVGQLCADEKKYLGPINSCQNRDTTLCCDDAGESPVAVKVDCYEFHLCYCELIEGEDGMEWECTFPDGPAEKEEKWRCDNYPCPDE